MFAVTEYSQDMHADNWCLHAVHAVLQGSRLICSFINKRQGGWVGAGEGGGRGGEFKPGS